MDAGVPEKLDKHFNERVIFLVSKIYTYYNVVVFNPRRACAASVTVVAVSVRVCVR